MEGMNTSEKKKSWGVMFTFLRNLHTIDCSLEYEIHTKNSYVITNFIIPCFFILINHHQ